MKDLSFPKYAMDEWVYNNWLEIDKLKRKTMKNLQEKLDKLKQEHQQTQANLLKLEGAIAIVAKLIEEETGGTDVG